jgi:hypothetical protein
MVLSAAVAQPRCSQHPEHLVPQPLWIGVLLSQSRDGLDESLLTALDGYAGADVPLRNGPAERPVISLPLLRHQSSKPSLRGHVVRCA